MSERFLGSSSKSILRRLRAQDIDCNPHIVRDFQIELLHEQLPLPVPCYDLLPVDELTVGGQSPTSGTPISLELTGGEYKT